MSRIEKKAVEKLRAGVCQFHGQPQYKAVVEPLRLCLHRGISSAVEIAERGPYFLCPATLERILSLFASEGEGEWTAPEYVIVLLRQPLAYSELSIPVRNFPPSSSQSLTIHVSYKNSPLSFLKASGV